MGSSLEKDLLPQLIQNTLIYTLKNDKRWDL
jgi:hypothetical protein